MRPGKASGPVPTQTLSSGVLKSPHFSSQSVQSASGKSIQPHVRLSACVPLGGGDVRCDHMCGLIFILQMALPTRPD